MGPLIDHWHVAMFDRVEVDVIHMPRMISIVPNTLARKAPRSAPGPIR